MPADEREEVTTVLKGVARTKGHHVTARSRDRYGATSGTANEYKHNY